MVRCLECNREATPGKPLCIDCYVKQKKQLQLSKNENGTSFPSHTDLYRDLYIIEFQLRDFLVEWLQNKFSKGPFSIEGFDYRIEERNWDLIFRFKLFNKAYLKELEIVRKDFFDFAQEKINDLQRMIELAENKKISWRNEQAGGILGNEDRAIIENEISKCQMQIQGWKQDIDEVSKLQGKDLAERLDEKHVWEKQSQFITLYVEYKSSIHEWGKQIDQFFRQIKSKMAMDRIDSNKDVVALISFDQNFDEYWSACSKAGFDLIVLPQELLYVLQGTNKQDKLARLFEIQDWERETAIQKDKSEKVIPQYSCIQCYRKIKHKGRCLSCNIKNKQKVSNAK